MSRSISGLRRRFMHRDSLGRCGLALLLIGMQCLLLAPGDVWAGAAAAFPPHTPKKPAAKPFVPAAVNRTVPPVASHPALPSFSAAPTDAEIAHSQVFGSPLVKANIGAGDPQENRALADALRRYAQAENLEDVSDFEAFLERFPNSAWRISLLAEVGGVYRKTGRYAKALTAWEKAWALGKRFADDARLKTVADETAGRLAALLSRLGRQERLAELLAEVADRPVGGAAYEWLTEAREALAAMRVEPGTSFQCGPLALDRLRAAQNPKLANDPRIFGFHSTKDGTSLAQVAQLAKSVGMNCRMAFREPGAAVVTPAVVHWKSGHFAPILEPDDAPTAGDIRRAPVRYRLEDATFGEAAQVSQRALDEEGSGYFLIPNQKLPVGWRTVDNAEGATVWGKGLPSTVDPDAQKCGSGRSGGGGSGCGMAAYSVFSMLVSLAMTDTPLGYAPGRGPAVAFTVRYSQRQNRPVDTAGHFNFGPLWTNDWLSYIEEQPNATNVNLFLPGGGGERYTGFNATTGAYALEFESAAQLVRLPDPTNAARFIYERRTPNGAKAVYAESFGVSPRRIFLTRIEDSSGNAVFLTYDNPANGPGLRLMAVTDATGKVTTLSYDLASDPLKVTRVTDPFGRFATLDYYAAGPNVERLRRITDVIGVWSQFEYDATGFITSLETPYDAGTPQGKTRFATGLVVNGANPSVDRFVEIADPYGDRERIEFCRTQPNNVTLPAVESVVPQGFASLNSNLSALNTFYWNKAAMTEPGRSYQTATTTTRWLGVAPSMVTDAIHSIKPRFGNRVWFAYEGGSGAYLGLSSQPIQSAIVRSDGRTAVSCMAYNAQGQPIQMIDPLGRVTEIDYAANGVDAIGVRQVSGAGGVSDALGQFEYDARHLPTRVTDASGATTLVEYDAQGKVTRATNALGETSSLVYDAEGRVIEARGPIEGARALYEYDAVGRVTAATDSDNYRVTMQYDAFDRVTRIDHPDGTFAEFGYDKLDPVFVRDRLGRTATMEYDALRRVTKTTDALGREIRYAYCTCGAVGSMTVVRPDASASQTTTWDRDPNGRVIAKTLPDGTRTTVAYDAATGQVASTTDARGVTTRWRYTLDGQVLQVSYELPPPVAAQTANAPRAQTQSAPNAAPQKRLVTPAVRYEYDAVYGRLSAVTDGLGTTRYAYNPVNGRPGSGELREVRTPQGDAFSYDYDALGRVTRRTVNGAGETVTYDALGRITQTVNSLGTFTGEYDGASGRLTRLTNPNGTETQLSYFGLDGEFRLRSLTHRKGAGLIGRHEYEYATDGAITRWTRQSGGGAGRTETYGYDAANRLLGATLTESGTPVRTLGYRYDVAGNRRSETAGGVAEQTPIADYEAAEWDALGRMTAVVKGTRRSEFQYDGGGRRVRITEKENNVVVSDSRYVWDGTGIVEERDARDNSLLKRFSGAGEEVFDAAGNSAKYFYATDHLGSVREVTDASGALTAAYDYDPYGRGKQTLGTFRATFGYASYFRHGASKLWLTVFRAYDPNQGRWLSRDPLGEAGGLNLYGYVGNDPVNATDPLGLCGFWDGVVDALPGALEGAGNGVLYGGLLLAAGVPPLYLAAAGIALAAWSVATVVEILTRDDVWNCAPRRNYYLGVLAVGVLGNFVPGPKGLGKGAGPKSARGGGGGPGSKRPNGPGNPGSPGSPTGPGGPGGPGGGGSGGGGKPPSNPYMPDSPLPQYNDIPTPFPGAVGPHTTLGTRIGENGIPYRQSATFSGPSWPKNKGLDVPNSRVDWTDHGKPWHHPNPHQHIFTYNSPKRRWQQSAPTPFWYPWWQE
jgi:RHS repeat-associated protein